MSIEKSSFFMYSPDKKTVSPNSARSKYTHKNIGSECTLCPRRCNADRNRKAGYCGEKNVLSVTRAALHFGEEPCISGSRGSGAIFFSGCPMHCVFCQNDLISAGSTKLGGDAFSAKLSPERLRDIFFRLIDDGAHNINLVTPTHFTDLIIKALRGGLPVPVVWNCGGYENIETLRKLDGIVDVYLPDFKYSSPLLAEEYSSARNYPEIAEAAVQEMINQTGKCITDKDGILVRGTLVRHLVLPGAGKNTRGVIDRIAGFPQDSVIFSLMSQYTPRPDIGEKFPELARRITRNEYENAKDYLYNSDIGHFFLQELSSADESYIPCFDGTGIKD